MQYLQAIARNNTFIFETFYAISSVITNNNSSPTILTNIFSWLPYKNQQDKYSIFHIQYVNRRRETRGANHRGGRLKNGVHFPDRSRSFRANIIITSSYYLLFSEYYVIRRKYFFLMFLLWFFWNWKAFSSSSIFFNVFLFLYKNWN